MLSLNPLEAKGNGETCLEMSSYSCWGWKWKGPSYQEWPSLNPDINYIGIDIQKSVLSYAFDKVLEVRVPEAAHETT